ncbi:MAG: MSCRAMM family protein [Thermomicrobiales bacterium]
MQCLLLTSSPPITFICRAWATAAVVMGLAAALHGLSVAAQDAARVDFPIYGLLCDDVPERSSPFSERFPPDGCRGIAGIEMQVESPTGEPIDSCVTGRDGLCIVRDLPQGLVIVREVASTLPDAYRTAANPRLVWHYTEFTGTEFYNVPADLVAATPPANIATLRVHSRVCPAGFTGTDYDGACHDTPPDYEQTLFLSGPGGQAVVIDDEGNATFDDLPGGTYVLHPGLPEATDRVVSFCSREGEPGVEYPSTVEHDEYTPPNLYSVEVAIEPGTDILCDVFAVPSA